jgi:DNA-binding response OmpR family regulator
MYKIMIIEDDPKISTIIFNYLNKWKFEPALVHDFESLDKQFIEHNPHLVLLDINLPVYDGYYWCRKIREISTVPIIFISSRDQNMDIVMAMNMGGDDFIQKPFSLEVLLAKLNAALRRMYTYQPIDAELIEHNGFVLNINKSSVTYNEQEINLTKNEFQIIYLLLKKKGMIVSREEIMKALWESENFIDDNTLTVNIARLRRKLEEIGLPHLIETKKRQGYVVI